MPNLKQIAIIAVVAVVAVVAVLSFVPVPAFFSSRIKANLA